MASPLKLASLWRVLKDTDLDAIRRAAKAPFTLAVAADREEDAVAVRALLTGADAPPHPWIHACWPASASDAAGGTPGTEGRAWIDCLSNVPSPTMAALLVTRTQDLSDDLKLAGNRFATSSTPVLALVVSDTSRTAKVLRPGEQSRVAVDALDAPAVEAIAAALVLMTTEDQQVALGAQLPPLRPAIFARTIERTARANASFSLTTGLAEAIPVLTAPLNLGDMVVLTKNQLMMCYRLVLTAGRDGDPKALMSEIIGVLGGGVLFRQIARQLVGLIPIAGLLPKVAIAYAGTFAIGKAMVAWTTEGRQITTDAVAAYSREGLVKGRALAEHLVETAGTTGGKVARRWERFRRFLPGKRVSS
jgi:uncharacterized protein (DUF697 family)